MIARRLLATLTVTAAALASGVASPPARAAGPGNVLGLDTRVHALAGVAPVFYGHGTFPDVVTAYLSTSRGPVPLGEATPNDPDSSMGSTDFQLTTAPFAAGSYALLFIESDRQHDRVASVPYRLVVDPVATRGCPSAAAVLPLAKRSLRGSVVVGVVRSRCVGPWVVAHASLGDGTGGGEGAGSGSGPADAFVLLYRKGSHLATYGAAAACRRHQVPPALVFEACTNVFATVGIDGSTPPQPER